MKTVTMRVDDTVYKIIKSAANGQKRNMSNFIEFATMQYLTSTEYVDSAEMAEISDNQELVDNLKSGLKDLENRNYTIV